MKNAKYAIFSDSFGMKAVKHPGNFPNGSTVVAFSGCCLLEYILIITRGSLLSQRSSHDRSPFVLHGSGRNFYGKLSSSQFQIIDFCDECKGNCYQEYSGKICIQVSLNTAIKANRASYKGQNVPLLVQNAFEVTKKVAPNASINFALPQEPKSHLYQNCQLQTDAFSSLIQSLEKYPIIGFAPTEAKKRNWHGDDNLHLNDKGNDEYWGKIKMDLQK